jgi:hypothetical protein
MPDGMCFFFAISSTIALKQLVLSSIQSNRKSYSLQNIRTTTPSLVLPSHPLNLQKENRFFSAKSCTLIAVRKIQPERKDDAHG